MLPLGDVEKTRIVPVMTYLLIVINIVLFIVEQEQPESFRVAFAATPYEITHGVDIDRPFVFHVEPEPVAGVIPAARPDLPIDQAPVPFPVWLTLITSLFLHGSPLHLAGNMLFLWIFGDNVEEVLGSFRYLLVYLACGVAGTLAQVAAAPDSLIPTLGASGAIAGMMGIYILWFPYNRVRVLVFNFLTIMPAYLVIGIWIVYQVVLGFGSIGHIGEVGGVAYLAHLGGAGAGLVFALLFRDRVLAFQEEELRRMYEPAGYE